MKKIYILVVCVVFLAVGCKKEEVEEKEYIINEDVAMFMNINQENGLGEFSGNDYEMRKGKSGKISFNFNIKNEEAEEEYERKQEFDELSGINDKLYLDGYPVFNSKYIGTFIEVSYIVNGYGSDMELKTVSYWAESDNEKMSNINYSFEEGKVISIGASEEYDVKKKEVSEKAEKSEVDELLIELTN